MKAALDDSSVILVPLEEEAIALCEEGMWFQKGWRGYLCM